MMNAIILARVSTREQEEGHSIQAQLQRLREYCQRKSLTIIKEFTIIESSTRGDRPEFHKMVEFIKKQDEKIALVCDKVDRLQRSFKEIPILEELRLRKKLVLHFNGECQILDENANSSQLMTYHMFVLMANNYTNCISDNVKRSFEQKLRDGTILGTAPAGYLNSENPLTGKKTVILDPHRALLVKRLFTEYATGLYSLREMRARAKGWGLTNKTKTNTPLSQSQIHKLIQNPFYYGVMKYKDMLYPHIYEPLISKALFDKCQEVRLGWGKTRTRSTQQPFLFRSLIKCAHCGCAYSPELKKEKYIYLRPTKNKGNCTYCHPIREEVAIEQIEAALRSISIPPERVESIKDTLRQSVAAKQDIQSTTIEGLQEQLQKVQGRIDNLTLAWIDQSITRDEYDKLKIQFHTDKHNIGQRMKNCVEADDRFIVTLEALLDLASRSYDLFKSSDIERKRKVVGLIFSNLQMDGEKLNFSMRKTFAALSNLPQSQKWLQLVDKIRTECYDDMLFLYSQVNAFKEIELEGKR